MSAPYTVNIDQQAARHYTDKGAMILLLEVPEQTHVAFDHQVSLLCELCDLAPCQLLTCKP